MFYYPVKTPVVESSREQNWVHGKDRVCFERTIDKQLYPLLNKTTE